MTVQQRRKIINRKDLAAQARAIYHVDVGQKTGKQADLKKRNAFLKLMKKALADGRAEIQKRLMAGENGLKYSAANSYLIDQVIRLTFDVAITVAEQTGKRPIGQRLAVVAVGGYGRGQMAPHSDVDLLFLHPYKAQGWTEHVIEFVLYMLWDLGLKVGHASRSVDACIQMSRSDVTIKTSLLESRFIYGDQTLHTELNRRFRLHARSDKAFVKAKLAERDVRHQRHGDSRYVLEPNIKEGKGGLRDLQTLYWIAKYNFGVEEVTDLEDQGVLTADEARTFQKAERFLLTVRCHLHMVANRAEERLTFDMQPQVSARLGYVDRDGLMGVERFMKHYFLVTKDVGDLTRVVCAAIEDQNKTTPTLAMPFLRPAKQIIDGFVAEGDRLTFQDEAAIHADPVQMMELFLLAQSKDMDVHPKALRLIHQNIKLVNAKFRAESRANSLFLDILTSDKDPGVALRRLNEAGILGRFLPDFGRVVAQMQHDMYHTYTVDEHTIRAITVLHKIEQNVLADTAPLATRVVKTIRNRRVLYLSVLLHDIAKGRGGDHSVIGADVARAVCARLGLDDAETDTVAWLVYHHLTMSMTATKRDLDDPKTLTDFVDVVQNMERLRLLAVLTTADIMAVGPNTWNAWKSQLLADLFRGAEGVMSGGVDTHKTDGRVQASKDAFIARTPYGTPQDSKAYADNLPASYWLHTDTDTALFHADVMHHREQAGARYWVEARPRPEQGMTEVFVVGPDRGGFFSTVAGAISLGRVSILEAKIAVTQDGLAVDQFIVQDLLDGSALDDPARLDRLYTRVVDALEGQIEVPKAKTLRPHVLPKRADALVVHPQVYVDLDASAAHTVIEVCGRDRPGLLHELTHVLHAHKASVQNAKIGTFGQRAVDVFYIKDQYGMKVTHPDVLQQINGDLMQVLQDLEDTASINHPDPMRDGISIAEDRGHLRHKMGITPDHTA